MTTRYFQQVLEPKAPKKAPLTNNPLAHGQNLTRL